MADANDEPELLTSYQAFLAMSDFVWEFGQAAGDDLLTLLGDTSLSADGMPFDRAAWSDWKRSVARIRAGHPPRSRGI